eukprot:363145-Chlamydomonas_euryale.AAC.11
MLITQCIVALATCLRPPCNRTEDLSGGHSRVHCCSQPAGQPEPPVTLHSCWDPKDGELCLSRVKPEETLVEARRCADVQIAFRTWV